MFDALVKGFTSQFSLKVIGGLLAIWVFLVLMNWLRATPEDAAGRLSQTVQPPFRLAA